MSQAIVNILDGPNPPEVLATDAARLTHANPIVRLGAQGNEFLRHYRSVLRKGKAVDIILPTAVVPDAIGEEDMIQMLTPAVNGHTDSKEQGVHVQYLSDDQRLVVPLYISSRAVTDHAMRAVASSFGVVEACRVAELPVLRAALAMIAAGTVPDASPAGVIVKAIPAASRALMRLEDVTTYVGLRNRASFRISAGPGDAPTADELEEKSMVVAVPVSSVADPDNPIMFQVLVDGNADFNAVRFANFVGLNADPRDHAAFEQAHMRLSDKAYQDKEHEALERFRPKLEAYTVSSIAALNYSRLKEIPLLAWTRAYLVSAGVLADANSKTHSEVAYTNTRPSKAIVKKLSEYHTTDPQRILLAAYSLGAMFGLQHLARDHTYKQGDEVLARVNKAYEKALATVLTDDDRNALVSAPHDTHRLVCHPFGLSQCYTLAMWGAQHKRIAEALQIRSNVCPPALNRVSMAVGVFNQVCALPVGSIIRDIFGPSHKVAEDYLKALGNKRSAFSALYHLYGWEKQLKIAPKVMNAVNTMMPMLAGYAEAFHTTNPETGAKEVTGAALAASIRNVRRDNTALVNLFSGLFTKYLDLSKEKGLEQFLIDQKNTIQLAMGNVAGEEQKSVEAEFELV